MHTVLNLLIYFTLTNVNSDQFVSMNSTQTDSFLILVQFKVLKSMFKY